MKRPMFIRPGVMVACDLNDIAKLEELVRDTCNISGICGYKVGFYLGLRYGLPKVVETIRKHTKLPVIYDHQKAGTDIPATGKLFAKVVAESGIDAVILFPFAGAATERAWIDACQEKDLVVMVGGHMTQEEFLVSEGGFIADEAPERIYEIAASLGVVDFIVPGNKVEFVEHYKKLLDDLLGSDGYSLSAPGFITQGGEVSKFALVAGKFWVAIVGSGIYGAENPAEAARKITAALPTR